MSCARVIDAGVVEEVYDDGIESGGDETGEQQQQHDPREMRTQDYYYCSPALDCARMTSESSGTGPRNSMTQRIPLPLV